MSLQPAEVQRRLSALWAAAGEGEWPPADEAGDAALAQMVEDCLARMAARRGRAQRTMLRQALQAADREGDRERVLNAVHDRLAHHIEACIQHDRPVAELRHG